MKKVLNWLLVLMVVLMLWCLPMAAFAEGEGGAGVDWTALVVSIIGAIGTVVSALLARVWTAHVKPWLEQKGLTDAAQIVVEAVEALLGRYCGEDKWKLALEKMAERGFYTDSQKVIDALKAAWKQLDLKQLAAGEKAAQAAYECLNDWGMEQLRSFCVQNGIDVTGCETRGNFLCRIKGAAVLVHPAAAG